jgi:hypothetical protein
MFRWCMTRRQARLPGLVILLGTPRRHAMLTVGMVVLGLVTFLAMLGFVTFCDRV